MHRGRHDSSGRMWELARRGVADICEPETAGISPLENKRLSTQTQVSTEFDFL